MTKDDVKAITKAVKSLNQFENNVEVMTVLGNIQHAAVVLNKTRDDAVRQSDAWRNHLAPGSMAVRETG